jgi:uncharacterized protein
MNNVMERIQKEVEKELSCSAHDMEHIKRVFNLCLKISKDMDLDMDVLKAAALLHDIARVQEDKDNSGRTDHAMLSAEMAEPILRDAGFPEEKIPHVQACIRSHRFKTNLRPESIEAKVLFDADKLDIVGAIGLARGFMWTGINKGNIYRKVQDINEYAKENLTGGKVGGRVIDITKHSPQIEFETKWKKMDERLNTPEAKKIFEERIIFVEKFLDRLEKEINGEL